MKALLFDGQLRLTATQPVPAPQKGEALVRVLLAGICATDLEIVRGYKEFHGIPGHEFVGLVEAVNGPDQGLLGRRVVGEINLGCGSCDFCRQGLENHCRRRQVLGLVNRNGACAEYLTLPLANLHAVPPGVADEEALFAEPLAAAFAIPEQVHLRPSDTVLVLGAGKLGLLTAQVLRSRQPHLLLAGRHADKLKLAASLGINIADSEELHQQDTFQVVVEATGSPSGLEQALRLVQPRGIVVLKSTLAEAWQIDLNPVVVKEIVLRGSRCGPFGPALAALAAGEVQVRPLLTRLYPLAQAMDAFRHAARPGTLKVGLDFRPGATGP